MKSLSGFTLFQTSHGWQLSTRETEEVAWSVRLISKDEATVLLQTVAPLTPGYIDPRPKDLFGRPVHIPARQRRTFL